jgi:hypothetical protein
MINADKLGKLDARSRPGTRRDNEFAAEEAKLLDELLAAADLSSPTTPDVRSDDQTSAAETAEGEVMWQAPVPPPEQPEEQAVVVWPSQYDAEASSAPTVAGATTTIDAEPGQPSEPRQAWTLGGTGLGDTQGSPQDLAASVDLSPPSSPDMPVSDQTDVADPPHFRVAWQAPAPPPEQPEEQAVVVWPSRYDAETSSAPTVADTTTTIDVDEAAENDKPRQAWSLDADLSTDEPTPVDELTASVGVSSAAAPALVAGDEESKTEVPQVASTWQPAAPEAPQNHAVPVWPSAYGTTTPAAPTAPDATTLADEEPGQVGQPHQAWSLDDTESSVVEPEIVAALAAFVDLSVPTTPELLAGDESGDDESGQVEMTSQMTVAAPDKEDEQAGPGQQAVTVWPPAYVAETAVPTLADPTAASDADEPGQVEELHQAESSQDTGLEAGEPEPPDVPAASADLASPVGPEVSTPEKTSDAETPHVEVTSQEAEASPEQPEQETVTAPPAAYSAAMAVTPAVSDTTPPVADKPREFEARYRPWTLRSAKLAAEEPKLFDVPAASADLASPVGPEVSTPEKTSDAETPHVEVTSQEAEASPEQPEKQQAPSWPSPFGTRTSASPTVPAATTPDDVPHDLDGRYRAWALRAAKLADEELKPVDKPVASADLASPEVPEVSSHIESNAAETSQPEVTSQASVSAPQSPAQPPAASWPSAFASRASASPTVPAAATSAEEPHDLDARYRAWILRAAGEPKPADRPVASADLSSPAAPEVPAHVETNEAETSQPEVTSQAPVSAPEQPREPARGVSPSASAAPQPVGPTFTGTTVNRANKPAKPDAPIRAWNFRDIASAVEEPSPTDKPHDVADPDVTAMAGDDASDTETPPLEVTSHAAPSAPQQTDEEVTVSPSADSAPEPGDGTVLETATSIAHKPGKLDARYRPWTMSAGELAAEKEEAGKELATDAHLSPSARPEVRSSEQASQAGPARNHETGQVVTASASLYDAPKSQSSAISSATTVSVGTKPRRARVSPAVIAVLALVFLLAALGTGFVALNQKSTTGQWHSRYQSQVVANRALSARNDVLSKDLASARAAITSLNSNTSALNGQIKSLQIQLSSASSAQQKAFAKTPLFGQISSEAVTAANEASVCAGEMGSLQTEINDDLANPTHKDPLLQGNTRTANLVCTVARQDNQQLQATLHSAR